MGGPAPGFEANGPRLWAGLHGRDLPSLRGARLPQLLVRRPARRSRPAERKTERSVSGFAGRRNIYTALQSTYSARRRRGGCANFAIQAAHRVGRPEHAEARTVYGSIRRPPQCSTHGWCRGSVRLSHRANSRLLLMDQESGSSMAASANSGSEALVETLSDQQSCLHLANCPAVRRCTREFDLKWKLDRGATERKSIPVLPTQCDIRARVNRLESRGA